MSNEYKRNIKNIKRKNLVGKGGHCSCQTRKEHLFIVFFRESLQPPHITVVRKDSIGITQPFRWIEGGGGNYKFKRSVSLLKRTIVVIKFSFLKMCKIYSN